jgi:hypothetical protein
MMFELRRAAVVGIAIAVLSVAVPARAQEEVPPPPPQEPALTEEVVLEEEIPAEPAFVTFRDIRDAVPMKFFNADPTQTKPDLEDPNTLVIAFNTGIDPKTWSANDLRASTGAYGNRNVMDTLSFTVVAPEGHYVRSITYSQKGAGIVLRTGSAHGSSSWVVGDHPVSSAPIPRWSGPLNSRIRAGRRCRCRLRQVSLRFPHPPWALRRWR